MDDDLSVFTPEDQQDIAYAVCVGGMGLVGGAVGRFAGLYGLLAGAVAGVGYGLIACKRLAPAIERKLLSRTDRLTDAEILQVLRVLQSEADIRSKRAGLHVLAHVRAAGANGGQNFARIPNACAPIRIAAAQLLAFRPASTA